MAILAERIAMYRISELIIPFGIIGILAAMIIPLPAIVLDMLLSINIAMAIIILLIAINMLKPLDFSIFPTILLVATLFRLSLNVASTRLVLMHGNEGAHAAGKVIQSFGTFVVGGNYAVGIVIFIILVIINFVVITKGAGRIAEVAARFTLDAMPGKQMAIDADLNAGIIRENEARERRKDVAREADFYGAMDGASKFVRGDAIAGILITLINIIGGIIIGVLQQGMAVKDALSVYTILTVGDGLVAQVPAIIISTAAGIVVTRAAAESDLNKEFTFQVFFHPKAIGMAAGILLILGIIPGLPHLSFLVLASITGGISYLSHQKINAKVETEEREDLPAVRPAAEKEEVIMPDSLAIDIGYRLIPLVDNEHGGELIERIKTMRKQLAADTGFLVPPIHVKDNLQRKPDEYVFLLRGIEVGSGEVMTNYYMAISHGNEQKGLEGIPTREPAFGLSALWIEEGLKDKAKLMGYTVAAPVVVIITHLTEVIRKHAHELVTRQDVQGLIDNVAKTNPKVIEELVPAQLSLGGVQKVLQNLLKEKIPIMNMLTIVETLADYAPSTKDTDVLTEYVRQALSRTITKQYIVGDSLPLMIIDPRLEDIIVNASNQAKKGGGSAIEPAVAQKFLQKVSEGMHEMASQGYQPVLMASPEARHFVKKITERMLPSLAVISSNEIAGDVRIKNVKVVSLENAYQKI